MVGTENNFKRIPIDFDEITTRPKTIYNENSMNFENIKSAMNNTCKLFRELIFYTCGRI